MDKIVQILQAIRNLIEEGKRVPLTTTIMIEQAEAIRLLDNLENEILREWEAINSEK